MFRQEAIIPLTMALSNAFVCLILMCVVVVGCAIITKKFVTIFHHHQYHTVQSPEIAI